jgi:SAM-dependent methyltransferase
MIDQNREHFMGSLAGHCRPCSSAVRATSIRCCCTASNRAAIRAGRVRLIHAPVQSLSISDGPFDAALAVNTVGMWPDPTTRLRELARLLRPGGRIALVSQPRCPGATAATSAAAASELAGLLTEAGFEHLRTEMLDLDPPAACVLGHAAPADDAELAARSTARS